MERRECLNETLGVSGRMIEFDFVSGQVQTKASGLWSQHIRGNTRDGSATAHVPELDVGTTTFAEHGLAIASKHASGLGP